MQVDTFKEIFTANKGLYPSLSQFLNDAKEKLDKEYKRNDAIKWYNAQEIVQVFAPPPLVEALKRKKGFYPKIISFAPFERLYVDTGSISIFKFTRKQEKQMEKKKNKVAVDALVGVVPSPVPPIIEEPSPLPNEESVIKELPSQKPTYDGKYKQYISVMETKKGSGKYVFYINRNRAKKLGLKDQDYKGKVEKLEALLDEILSRNKLNEEGKKD